MRVVVPTVIVLAVIVVLFVLFSQLWTEILWFSQVGFSEVLTTEILIRVLLFVVAGLFMAAAVFVGLWIGYRFRPIYPPSSASQENLSRYQASIEPLRKILLIGAPIVVGFFAGVSALAQWDTFLLWWNREPFGQTDPEFGIDIGFYVFTLPWLRAILSFLFAAVVISGLAALLSHYLYGGLRIVGRQLSLSKAARIQLAVVAGVFVLLMALNFWLDRYATLFTKTSLITGAAYTDVHAGLPTKAILAVASVLVALLFLAAGIWGRWRLPLIGTGLVLAMSLVVGGVYPMIVQRFQVQPSEQTMEAEYIQRNIDSTRSAYGFNDVETINYDASTEASAGALRQDSTTTANIRLMDPSIVSASFAQLEQYRQYYSFPQQLDVDRYQIDGRSQDTVISVRELNVNGISGGEQSWYNSRVVYTHGYGVVAAYGNQRSSDGTPVFMQSGIPTQGSLGKYEPRVYFGENSPSYSIVGAPEGSTPVELDYPTDSSDKAEANTTFKGSGGPSVGNIFNRLVYALKFQDEEILFSDAINSDSQILYERDPKDRVAKVAPFLTLDGDPYPTVVDGRIKWVVDGYTTSSTYPYSTHQTLNSATTDSTTVAGGNVSALPNAQVNYIRNSVKATVDAYDGSVTLYAWDEEDPVLKAWRKVFPDAVQPLSEISSDLMSHVRYPEDLFKVQRSLLGTYHVTDADAFYSQQDAWNTPNDPTTTSGSNQNVLQPPYYLTLQMPGQEGPSFSLTSTFIPRSSAETTRNVLTGFLSADANAGDKKGERSESYGKLRLLVLPRDTVVPGPGQVQNNFNADPTVSQALNLLRQGESVVQNGNLLTLPVGNGFLYVQPVYVRSAGETSYPLLQRVLVAFGDKIGFATTLDEALDQLFGGDSGATAGDAKVQDNQKGAAGSSTAGSSENSDGNSGSGQVDQAALDSALKDASQAMKDSEAAMKDGDWTKYGEAQKRLNDSLQKAIQAGG